MLFFDKKPAAEQPWTRTCGSTTCAPTSTSRSSRTRLRREHLDDFVDFYLPGKARRERVESERWKSFTYDELIARDKVNLDITWLRDESSKTPTTSRRPSHRPRDRRRPHRGARGVRGGRRGPRGHCERRCDPDLTATSTSLGAAGAQWRSTSLQIAFVRRSGMALSTGELGALCKSFDDYTFANLWEVKHKAGDTRYLDRYKWKC